MSSKVVAESGRVIACFPAAILVFVVNEDNEILLFSQEENRWTIIAGAIEAGETILDSALRELREEAGTSICVNPIGVVHAHSFNYDPSVEGMISIYYVVKFKKGEIIPGDDMAGAEYRWWSLDKIKAKIDEIKIPDKQYWMFERAVEFCSSFENQDANLEYFVTDEKKEK